MLSPVRLLHGWISQNYFEFSKPEASICIPQPKSNYVHFALNIWHLVATILMIFLRINCPNLGQFDWIIKVFRDLQYRYANAMLPLSLRKVWKVSKLTRPEIHQFIKQFSNVARVDHLYMVDHVKFLMHLRLYGICCSIIIRDWWMGPLRKILGPGPPLLMYTVCRDRAQTRETGFTILCYSATIFYQWMSAVSGRVFQ